MSIDLCISIEITQLFELLNILIQNLPAISGRLETASILKADILIQDKDIGSITKILLVKYTTKGIMTLIRSQMPFSVKLGKISLLENLFNSVDR